MSIGDKCKISICEKLITQKRTALCTMHKSRWEKYKSFELPYKEPIPVGYLMNCKIHGLLTEREVAVVSRKSRIDSKEILSSKSCRYCKAICQKKLKASKPLNYKITSRKSNLKRKFDMSIDDFIKMKESQKYVCAICKNPETALDGKTKILREFCIDHCHETGVIRGLLCNRCNHGIGKLRDSIEILESAIEYLRPHK